MEEILLNIDSRYRDILVYQNECKFRFNLEKNYKNIISARMISIEVNNSASYLDDKKQNNFITIHLPNKINDPDGIKLQLDEGLYQIVGVIQNMFNGLFQQLFNNNNSLKKTTLDGKPFAEKYFYFLYLNYDTQLTFDFNSIQIPPPIDPNLPPKEKLTNEELAIRIQNEEKIKQAVSISTKLILKKGWYSIYGIVLIIQNYIKSKYDIRYQYKTSFLSDTTIIDLDSGNFKLEQFELPIFDRRFRHQNKTYDCVRYDKINEFIGTFNNLVSNLNSFKEHIYKTYIEDTITYIPITDPSIPNQKILDQLNTGNYKMPTAPNNVDYTIEVNTYLDSRSIYPLNIAEGSDDPTFPTTNSTQIYNLILQIDLTSLKTTFSNFFTKTISSSNASENFAFYYYYSPIPGTTDEIQTWNNVVNEKSNNLLDNIFSDKNFAYTQGFITEAQKNDPLFFYTAEKDIAEFEIDFSTYQIINPVKDGLTDIKRMVYPPVGYYLGYRPNITKIIDQFIFKGIINNTERVLKATKIFDTTGDDYMFLKINDWGYIDFFGKKLFAKVLLTTGLGNPKIEDYVNKEFRFRQPIDINRLDIELVDYLGNTIDLGGFDWSFTIEFKQIINSTEKTTLERNALVFNNV